MSANIGWLFYRDYYEKGLDQKNESKANQERHFKAKTTGLTETKLPTAATTSLLALPGCNESFTLTTVYPGMLIGTGYTHETGMMGEVKIGFFFDHTTGLPVLPSSSVKGILRSVFPGDKNPTLEQKRLREQKMKFLRTQLNRVGVTNTDTIDLNALEDEIFDGIRNGEAVPLPQRDIFGDAFPSQPVNQIFLGIDFITPHGKDLTKNPTPIQMLRILPGVTFTFQFWLTNGLIDADAKCKLFRLILLHLGVGAKTNVGYGRFATTPSVSDAFYKPAGLTLLPTLKPRPQPESALSADVTTVESEPKPPRKAEPFRGKIKPGAKLDGEYVGPKPGTKNRHYCNVWLASGNEAPRQVQIEGMYASPLTPGQLVVVVVKDGKDKINLADISPIR